MRLVALAQSALLACSAFWGTSAALVIREADQLHVKTTSGTLIGKYNATSVRAFLGVPYAYPPTGTRRFAAPVPYDVSADKVQNVTAFGYTCPGQYYPGTSIYTQLPFLPFTQQNEDCLKLNVWAPTEERIKAKGGKLPVLVFVPGGYFTQGGSAAGSTDATNLVSNNDVIVVTMNYRLSVFGFPNVDNARNLGLLDQRVALEWARNNAIKFGGDPSRITLFGQSAGGISADAHMFAKWNATPGDPLHDAAPIPHAVGILSGGVLLDIYSTDKNQTQFGQLGAAVGCNTTKNLLKCMRSVPAETLLNEIVVNGTARGWNFAPIPDEQLVFSNYTERILSGKMSKVPTFFSSLENETTGLVPFDPQGNINMTLAYDQMLKLFICPTSMNSRLRVQAGVPTYRMRYGGNFTNISPYPFLGTYHGAELPMIFGGATPEFGGRNSTTEESRTAGLLQSIIVSFATDPKNGLGDMGWPGYNPENDTIVVVSPPAVPKLESAGMPGWPQMMLDSSIRYDAPCNS
ncbi:hypothetical protein FRC09_009146 [Ceratobasidium sp. 395]|nr:hypothetical protein FRC09_009146 [Ceratobasidium sp. 395]